MYSLLFVAALPGQFVQSDRFTEAQQKAAFGATVAIYHDPSRSFGTAVIVGRKDSCTYLLTAAHLVPKDKPVAGRENEDMDKVGLTFYPMANSQKPIEDSARVVARMPNEDLAVLKASLPDHHAIARICPNEREKKIIQLPIEVMTVGAVLDNPPEIKIDWVRDKKFINKPDGTSAIYWEADIPQPIGRSGGPMIDARGYVIGIASGTQHKKGYYTHLDEIIRALHREGYDWLTEVRAVKK
jgi:hypothetical protein